MAFEAGCLVGEFPGLGRLAGQILVGARTDEVVRDNWSVAGTGFGLSVYAYEHSLYWTYVGLGPCGLGVAISA